MIKAGQLAIIRSSNEYCFVLEVKDGKEAPADGFYGAVAVVRVPLLTRDGVRHEIQEFFVEELQTEEDRDDAQIAREDRNQQRIFQLHKAETPPGDEKPN